jgi:hypothetical protein
MRVSIDSLKIRLPLENLKWLSAELKIKWANVSEAGEIDERGFKARRLIHDFKGIRTSYDIQRKRTSGGTMQDSLIVMVSAKALKGRYFEGITPLNIRIVFDYLISQKYFRCNYKTFLEAYITDVDIKKDYGVESLEAQKLIVKTFADITIPSRNSLKGHNLSNTDSKIIITWNSREKANFTSPFCKVYAKDIELRTKSNIFFDFWFQSECCPIIRTEATIKNSDHFRLITKDKEAVFSLDNALTYISNNGSELIHQMFCKHVEKPSVNIREDKLASVYLSDIFTLAFLDLCKVDGKPSPALAKVKIQPYILDAKKLFRARKKIDEIYQKFCFEPVDHKGTFKDVEIVISDLFGFF